MSSSNATASAPSSISLVCWNVAGWNTTVAQIRKFHGEKEGIKNYLEALKCDILCLQESKTPKKRRLEDPYACGVCDKGKQGMEVSGWESFWCSSAERLKGMNGVAAFVRKGLVHKADAAPFDSKELNEEGRCIVLQFSHFVLFNVYVVNGRGGERYEFKVEYLAALRALMQKWRSITGLPVIIVGDFNTTYRAHDCHWTRRRLDLDRLRAYDPEAVESAGLPPRISVKEKESALSQIYAFFEAERKRIAEEKAALLKQHQPPQEGDDAENKESSQSQKKIATNTAVVSDDTSKEIELLSSQPYRGPVAATGSSASSALNPPTRSTTATTLEQQPSSSSSTAPAGTSTQQRQTDATTTTTATVWDDPPLIPIKEIQQTWVECHMPKKSTMSYQNKLWCSVAHPMVAGEACHKSQDMKIIRDGMMEEDGMVDTYVYCCEPVLDDTLKKNARSISLQTTSVMEEEERSQAGGSRGDEEEATRGQQKQNKKVVKERIIEDHFYMTNYATCFDQYRNKRFENEGTRIDYILVDNQLKKYLKKAPTLSDPTLLASSSNTIATISSVNEWDGAYLTTAVSNCTANGRYQQAPQTGGGMPKLEQPEDAHYHLKTNSTGWFGAPPLDGIIFTPPQYSDHMAISTVLHDLTLTPRANLAATALDKTTKDCMYMLGNGNVRKITDFFQKKPQPKPAAPAPAAAPPPPPPPQETTATTTGGGPQKRNRENEDEEPIVIE